MTPIVAERPLDPRPTVERRMTSISKMRASGAEEPAEYMGNNKLSNLPGMRT